MECNNKGISRKVKPFRINIVTSHVYFHIFVSATALYFTEFGEERYTFTQIQGHLCHEHVPTTMGKNRTNSHKAKRPREGFQALTSLQRSEVHLKAIVYGKKSESGREEQGEWATVYMRMLSQGRIRCCVNVPDRSSIVCLPNPGPVCSIVHSQTDDNLVHIYPRAYR